MAEVDAVYWAIGISSIGVDEKTYGVIHVDFPMQFVAAWTNVSDKPDISFHYISSSDISEDSSAMWAREKVRAERSLFALATLTSGGKMRLNEKRRPHSNRQKHNGHLSTMRGFARPDSVGMKPIKDVRSSHPGRKGNGEFEGMTRLFFQRIQHAQIVPCAVRVSS